jgi:plastocyanin
VKFSANSVEGAWDTSLVPLTEHFEVLTQDLKSNVFALERATGEVRWSALLRHPQRGPQRRGRWLRNGFRHPRRSGETGTVTINAPAGTYEYYCSIPGHGQGGMVGTLVVQ